MSEAELQVAGVLVERGDALARIEVLQAERARDRAMLEEMRKELMFHAQRADESERREQELMSENRTLSEIVKIQGEGLARAKTQLTALIEELG